MGKMSIRSTKEKPAKEKSDDHSQNLEKPSCLRLLPVKFYYFLHEGGGSISPFISLVAKNIGLSLTVIGTINTITVAAALLMKPVVGGLIDKFGHSKCVWLVCHLLTVAALLSLVFIPPISSPQPDISNGINATWHCTEYGAHFDVCNGQNFNFLSELNSTTQNPLVEVNAVCRSLLDSDWLASFCVSERDCEWQFTDNLRQVHLITNVSFLVDLRQIRRNSKSCVLIDILKTSNYYLPAKCPHSTEMSCVLNYNDTSLITTSATNVKFFFWAYQFWWLVVAVVAAGISKRLVDVIQTSVVYNILGDQHSLFGKQKLFGSFGFAMACITGGVLGEFLGDNDDVFEYRYNFYICGVTMTLACVAICFCKVEPQSHAENIVQDVGFLFLRLHNCVIFTSIFFLGAFFSFQSTYAFWYLVDLGATPIMLGLAKGSQSLFTEMPCLFISGWVIKKFGHNKILCFIFLLFSINFCTYAFMSNIWVTFSTEILNGIAYGLFIPTATSYFTLVAPPGTVTTLQGIFFAIFKGAGRMLGNLGGGLLYEYCGGRETYIILSIMSLACFFTHMLLHNILQRREIGKLQVTSTKTLTEKPKFVI